MKNANYKPTNSVEEACDGKDSVFYKRLIITHRKDLNRGDYLIDDRTKNGAGEFQGELIQFGSEKFPDWFEIRLHLFYKLLKFAGQEGDSPFGYGNVAPLAWLKGSWENGVISTKEYNEHQLKLMKDILGRMNLIEYLQKTYNHNQKNAFYLVDKKLVNDNPTIGRSQWNSETEKWVDGPGLSKLYEDADGISVIDIVLHYSKAIEQLIIMEQDYISRTQKNL